MLGFFLNTKFTIRKRYLSNIFDDDKYEICLGGAITANQ
jgi:hypothetical protein